jgi:predicted aspartyl protease
MAISGRYGDTSHARYLDGHIIIPGLGIRGSVSFLIDTGADASVLAETDARRIGVDYRKLTRVAESYGIGGVSRNYSEAAAIVLQDASNLHLFDIEVTIMRPNRSSLSLNYASRTCLIEIVNSDRVL